MRKTLKITLTFIIVILLGISAMRDISRIATTYTEYSEKLIPYQRWVYLETENKAYADNWGGFSLSGKTDFFSQSYIKPSQTGGYTVAVSGPSVRIGLDTTRQLVAGFPYGLYVNGNKVDVMRNGTKIKSVFVTADSLSFQVDSTVVRYLINGVEQHVENRDSGELKLTGALFNVADTAIVTRSFDFSSTGKKGWLLIGQSNMRGRGDSLLAPVSGQLEFNQVTQTIEPLKEPAGQSSPFLQFQEANTGSLASQFAKTLFDLRGDSLVIVHAAKGGTGIADTANTNTWMSYDHQTHLSAGAAIKMQQAQLLFDVEPEGILIYQGENEGNGNPANYNTNLQAVIAFFRTQFPGIPFGIIVIGYTQGGDSLAVDSVRMFQQMVINSDSRNFYAGSAAGETKLDGVHLDQPALNRRGDSAAVYANEFLNDFIFPIDTTQSPSDTTLAAIQFGTLSITLNEYAVLLKVEITDLGGQVVHTTTLANVLPGEYHYVLQKPLASGMYIRRVWLDGTEYQDPKKIIVQ